MATASVQDKSVRPTPPIASSAFDVPTISLAQSRHEIIQSLREASLNSGFFQLCDIESHVPASLVEQMFEQMVSFFDLPESDKQKVLKKDHLVGGYEGFLFYDLTKTGDAGKESKATKDSGWNEGFAIAPEWGTNCFPQANNVSNPLFNTDLFENTCKAYFHAVQELGRHVLGMIAEGLGIQREFFEPYLEKQNSFCRLTHYYRSEQPEGVSVIQAAEVKSDADGEVEVGAAAHTDWGALTLLIQDLIGGLQVYDRAEGQWHDVPPLPIGKGFVCNIGDLLSRWTNDAYKSTLHRVIAPPRGVHRYSIPFFNPGNRSYIVQTIPTCVKEGGTARYDPITAGDYITMRHLQSTGAM